MEKFPPPLKPGDFGVIGILAALSLFGGANSSLLYSSLNLSGYAKTLDFVSRDSDPERYRGLIGNRLRLDGEWQDRSETFDLKLISDEELLFGSLLSSQRTSLSSNLVSKQELLKLTWTLNEKENLIWRHSFYRAYLKARFGTLEGTAGRQRIAWGQGRIWNPTDRINPYNPLSVEREERRGSDALDVKWNVESLSFLEAVWVPNDDWRWKQSTLLGRARVNWHEMDWGFLGGQNGDENLAGFDSAAQVFEGSLRSELSYSFGSSVRRDFLRAVLSFDYSFANSFYLLGEYYFNGIGEPEKGSYSQVTLKPNEQQFLAKDYIASSVKYDLTPLVKTELTALLNLNDQSTFLSPRILWQPLTDLEFSLGYQAFVGGQGTEFGSVKDVGFVQVQWFFSLAAHK